jgi:hypothetical protein
VYGRLIVRRKIVVQPAVVGVIGLVAKKMNRDLLVMDQLDMDLLVMDLQEQLIMDLQEQLIMDLQEQDTSLLVTVWEEKKEKEGVVCAEAIQIIYH